VKEVPMCEIAQRAKKLPKGRFDLSLTCKKTGKPITVSNQWGMFCEDLCDLEACKDAEKLGMELIRQMLPDELK
jgi:hypothetical protein